MKFEYYRNIFSIFKTKNYDNFNKHILNNIDNIEDNIIELYYKNKKSLKKKINKGYKNLNRFDYDLNWTNNKNIKSFLTIFKDNASYKKCSFIKNIDNGEPFYKFLKYFLNIFSSTRSIQQQNIYFTQW